MKVFQNYIESIKDEMQQKRMVELFDWIAGRYPELEAVIKWNQPMYTDHGSFIIGFSKAKGHMSFSLEEAIIQLFSDEIKASGYEHTKMLGKIKWSNNVDYKLLQKMINYNIEDKKTCTTFFRK